MNPPVVTEKDLWAEYVENLDLGWAAARLALCARYGPVLRLIVFGEVQKALRSVEAEGGRPVALDTLRRGLGLRVQGPGFRVYDLGF